MIGNHINGTNLQGLPVSGLVHDKVLSMVSIGAKAPGQIGGAVQSIPMPLDVYLVQDEQQAIHMVLPASVSKVQTPEDIRVARLIARRERRAAAAANRQNI